MQLALWAAAFCAAATFVHLATLTIAALRCRGVIKEMTPPDPLPATSVLRPVCGLDAYAEATLESSFALDRRNYEILFCAARRDDHAVPLVENLIANHPHRAARLLIGGEGGGGNPKLNNLVKGWDAARHEWIVIADSNALLPCDALQRLHERWQDDTGAVCSMPIGSRPESLWAEVECAFLNTLQARFQYVAEALGCGFAQGKVMLFRRDLIDEAGGLRMLASETAEDAAATKLVRAVGLQVRLVDSPFEQPLGRRSLGDVWTRQLRWARLRRVSFTGLFIPEILLGSFFPALALAVAAPGFGLNPMVAVVTLLALWFSVELALARSLGWHCSLRLIPALLLRDLALPLLWIAAWLSDGIVWRGTAMSVARASASHRRHRAPSIGEPAEQEG